MFLVRRFWNDPNNKQSPVSYRAGKWVLHETASFRYDKTGFSVYSSVTLNELSVSYGAFLTPPFALGSDSDFPNRTYVAGSISANIARSLNLEWEKTPDSNDPDTSRGKAHLSLKTNPDNKNEWDKFAKLSHNEKSVEIQAKQLAFRSAFKLPAPCFDY